jgi:hypothetical protein
VRNLLLPSEPGLAVDLSGRLETSSDTTVVQQNSAEDNLVIAKSLLRMVDVSGAVLAVVLDYVRMFELKQKNWMKTLLTQ